LHCNNFVVCWKIYRTTPVSCFDEAEVIACVTFQEYTKASEYRYKKLDYFRSTKAHT